MAIPKRAPIPRISLDEVRKKLSEVTFVDARSATALARNPWQVRGAVHVPVKTVEQALRRLPRNHVLVTYCT